MDASLIYSQLINFGDFEAESYDEIPAACYSSMNTNSFIYNNGSNNSSDIYNTLELYNKTYLNCHQPLSAEYNLIYPHQGYVLKSSLTTDTQLTSDRDEALHHVMIEQQKENYGWLYHDSLNTTAYSSQLKTSRTCASPNVCTLIFIALCLM
jgi:hypothetical protein